MKSANLRTLNGNMKFTTIIPLLGLFAAASSLAEMRDAATHEQLVLSYRKASQEDPARKMTPTKGPDPLLVNPPKDLIGDSDILCFNGMATLVPKRAVLQIPKNMAGRLKYVPGAKLLSWADFYAVNRGWITTMEVSRVQAEGNSPLGEVALKQMSKNANLIVATYQAGPISVLPLKVPAEKAGEKAGEKATTVENISRGPKS